MGDGCCLIFRWRDAVLMHQSDTYLRYPANVVVREGCAVKIPSFGV